MNVFDAMASGTYQPVNPPLSDKKRYMLAKQIPSIPDYQLVIQTKYGHAIINEPELIKGIKQLIENHYSNCL